MSETRDPRPRRRRLLRAAVGLLVLLAVIGYFAVQRDSNGGGGAPFCVAGADPVGADETSATYEMSPEQAANAATIAAVGVAKGLPDRAVTIALATAMQESALRNLDHGDRDSLGLFQQRPSMGWGTPEQITDPVYSAGIFYDHLVDVPGYSRLPLTVAAQKVQRSGFPQAYAKHEPDATVLTAAFAGGGSLNCGGPAPAGPGDPQRVQADLIRIFGKDGMHTMSARAGQAGGSTGGSTGGGQVAPEPEVTLVEKKNGGEEATRRSRAMAHWAVANAKAMGISRVSYGRHGWVAGKDRGRWQDKGGAGTKEAAKDTHYAGPGEVRIFMAR
ncbi:MULTISPECIES: hypothetical protein [unclassified Streptomyces]|uniref:hypothetical protein n=1 Tax=unclassified Streptomyces TaxID=2593676 RepID=UPI0004BD8773|nr:MULTISPECIES: hypothetical protein [unclassified Streptomyces]